MIPRATERGAQWRGQQSDGRTGAGLRQAGGGDRMSEKDSLWGCWSVLNTRRHESSLSDPYARRKPRAQVETEERGVGGGDGREGPPASGSAKSKVEPTGRGCRLTELSSHLQKEGWPLGTLAIR